MREIEFRAKAINRNPEYKYRTNYKNGDWVYGLLTELQIETSFGTSPAQMTNKRGVSGIDVDIETLGQYTGLKDKNGKKIFEGDIILYDNIQKVVVSFENGHFVVDHYAINLLCERNNKSEVIGNVYDNPELLKGE